jgi:hypothetical protein
MAVRNELTGRFCRAHFSFANADSTHSMKGPFKTDLFSFFARNTPKSPMAQEN